MSKDDLLGKWGLLRTGKTLAIPMLVPLIDEFPFLKTIRPEDWDFFATVAFIQVAFADSNRKVNHEALFAEIEAWSPKGTEALVDCGQAVSRFMVAGANLPDSIGFWVLANLLQRTPTEDEHSAIGVIGGMIVRNYQELA